MSLNRRRSVTVVLVCAAAVAMVDVARAQQRESGVFRVWWRARPIQGCPNLWTSFSFATRCTIYRIRPST
jgi:hypothetical protein